ncbi:FtsX-like permease family protein [Streptomyces roseoverticillatus]|uniref:FtsX-like permease family protein n=1 Tax=Streptomyces roseoverticillatus TaxID=66429 RepID=UPI001F46D56F|nr:FtsX-like permease family protein [Streptomyces roseoverticillatus]
MTGQNDEHGAPRPGRGPADRPTGPTGAAAWLRDLRMGARFTIAGGREGLLRAALTALAVGLGVAVLAIAASVPHLLDERDRRTAARQVDTPLEFEQPGHELRKSSSTLVYRDAGTDFRDKKVGGALLRPEGAGAPVPPGVTDLPRPGEMVVSPALGRLLDSDAGKLLRERLPYRTAGTIAPAGLVGPGELFFYAGDGRLAPGDGAVRIDRFGDEAPGLPTDGELVVLIALACVILLLPVGVFISAAVRFGGEGRDQRLAALRLVGADGATARRIAAGEALCGALLGLLAGAGIFLFTREFATHVTVRDVTLFPSDVTPSPALAALIAVAVPVLTVVVTLSALRRVAIEPLGVVRGAPARRRRLWWRLLIPAVGLALLVPSTVAVARSPFYGPEETAMVAAGAALLLIGVATVLPWLVEACVARFRGGPLPWQLATRRLQAGSGTAARAVSGITVAVAGAIAVQMVLSGMQSGSDRPGGSVESWSHVKASSRPGTPEEIVAYTKAFRATPGVQDAVAFVEQYATALGKQHGVTTVHVADCSVLRTLARIDSCRDGDVFVADEKDGGVSTARRFPPGTALEMDGFERAKERGTPAYRWTVPASARVVETLPGPTGDHQHGVLATPSAIDARAIPDARTTVLARVDPGDRDDSVERFRNTAAAVDPGMRVWRLGGVVKENHLAAVEEGLTIGAVCVLALIAVSMLVGTLEQLRERRRALSVLVACGTSRATIGWSVLWQTAVPVALGMALAVGSGLGLGRLLLALIDERVRDWFAFVPLIGAGAGMIVLVTVACLPALWRLTRPESLRTE